jgi:hypothetical protein
MDDDRVEYLLARFARCLVAHFGDRAIDICLSQRIAALAGSATYRSWGDLETRVRAVCDDFPRKYASQSAADVPLPSQA